MAERRSFREMVDTQFAEYTGLSCKDMAAEKTKRAWTDNVRAEQTIRTGIAAMGSTKVLLAAAGRRKRRKRIEEIKILSAEHETQQRDLRGDV